MSARKYKQRADGRYSTAISTGKRDPETGKPIRVTLYAKTSRELERKVAEMQYEVRHGTYADDRGYTLGQYAQDKWLPAKYNSVDYSTYQNYERIVRLHFGDLEDMRLQDIMKSDVERQISEIDGSETRRLFVITIRQVLESAIDDGLLYRNVARKAKTAASAPSEKRALNDAEREAIRKCSLDPMNRIFVDLLYGTGLRRGEALALTIGDFDFQRAELHVNRSLSWSGSKHLKEPKTASSYRTVTMPLWLSEEIKEYLDSRPETSLYLFCDTNGQLISETSFRRMWNTIYNSIQEAMPKGPQPSCKLTPHIFRHNYCTMLYYSGIDVKEAQRLMGHSSIKVTLQIYTHLAETEEETREKINNLIL